MLKKSAVIIAGILLFIGASGCFASGPGTTAANFLKIGVGARATSMGGAFTALADDATALYWNPAGLSQLKKGGVSASYNSWFADVSQGYLVIAFPALWGKIALGGNYVSAGTMEGYDASGNSIGDFSASAIQASLGYALGGRFSLGLAGGMLQDSIGEDKKTSYLGTAGILLRSASFSLGASAQNLGQKLEGDPLPLTYRGGIAVRLGSINLAADAVKEVDNDMYYCGGLELWLGPLALRGGYRTGQDIGPGYTAGVGFKITGFSLDYAYVPYADLGITHRISLGIGF